MKLHYRALFVVAMLFTPLLFAGAKNNTGTPLPQLFPSFSSASAHKQSSSTIVHTPTKPINTIGWNWGHSDKDMTASSTPPKIEIGHGTSTPPPPQPQHPQAPIEFLQSFFGRFFR